MHDRRGITLSGSWRRSSVLPGVGHLRALGVRPFVLSIPRGEGRDPGILWRGRIRDLPPHGDWLDTGAPDVSARADGSPVSCPSIDPLRCLLEQGAGVTRCLGDDRASLVQLDIDWVNHEDPAEAYRDPALCFETLEPVYRAAKAWFHSCGLRPLVIMTRLGYHLAGRVVRESRAHELLVSMGRIGEP